MRRWGIGLLVGVVALIAVIARCEAPRRAVRGRVVEVVDGDTVVVTTGDAVRLTVRLLGVDTPETKKPGVPVQCFGPEASRYTHARLEGREVTLTFDVERHDKYGRTLAAVSVDGHDYARDLIANGYARVLSIAPNRRNARTYLGLELDARRDRRGLWGACER